MRDAVLVLGWLVLAHLVADFVLQTGGVARAKAGHGSRAAGGLLAHGLMVAACLVPVGFAYGDRGWAFLATVAVAHVVTDRVKVVLTRLAAAAEIRDAHVHHEHPQPADHLGRAWTPRPAALFLADQAVHLLVLAWGWAVFLAASPLTAGWTAAIDGWLDGWDRATVHAVVGGSVILASLAILNIRAASLFVGILVRPVEAGVDGEHRWGGQVAQLAEPPTPAVGRREAPEAGGGATATRRWSIRLGPLDARITAEPEPEPAAARRSPAVGGIGPSSAPLGASARVGSTIGILERILIVVFVLTGSDVAIGFVVAAKTLARFKLLDDRAFAEYYLLGTLASVAVAILSALVGRAALGALLG